MEGLSQLALVWDKQVFDTFYQPCRPNKDEDYSESQLPLASDSNGMTRLHRAAFYGDAEIVDDILETIRNDFSSGQHPDAIKLLVESAVTDIMLAHYDKSFTPFYVAAACDHKEICLKILSFLKEIRGADHKEDLTCYGFVHSAMWDAILFKNLQMFQVILEAVKEACGQNSLLDLLKTEKEDRRFSSRFDNSILTPKKLWKTKVRFFSRMTEKRVTKICSIWCTKYSRPRYK
jgi:ankyrin repeat protein